ncbi:hypothetical protein BPJM79_40240 [Bacillus pumilus]
MIPFCVLCSSYIPKKAILAKKGGAVELQLIFGNVYIKTKLNGDVDFEEKSSNVSWCVSGWSRDFIICT